VENTLSETPAAAAATVNGPFDLILAGGPVVMLLIAMSVLALTVILYKLSQFVAAGVFRKKHVERAVTLVRQGHPQEALASTQGAKDPAARAMAAAIRGSLRKDVTEAETREEVERITTAEIGALRAHLGLLELIGSLAPLLGLLGTVLGMITAFQAMEAAGRNVDPSVLSGGIWAALLTTAAGLIVAIPVVAIANWFDRTISQIAWRMEDAVTCVFSPDLSTHSESVSNEARSVSA
jgi:biopolymer transport protein ExbB